MNTAPGAPPALYLRRTDTASIAEAADLGVDGVSFELTQHEDGSVRAGTDPLEKVLDAARELGLALELVAGGPLDARVQTPPIAATVATMVSSRQVRRGVRLTSFDHEAVTTIGRSVEGLELGLRHLVTLHRGEEYARRHGATALHPMAEFASIAETDRARALGIGTHAWTLAVEGWPVDEGEQLDSAVRAGVDAVTVSSIALLSRKELS